MGFADTWTDADPEGNNDNPPPAGTYDVALMDASAFTSKAGDDYVKFEWQTVDRQYHWPQLGGFGSLKQAGFTKGQCLALGLDVDSVGSLEEVDSALKAFVGKFYEVKVVQNGEYINTYVEDGEVTPASHEPDVPADTSDLQPVPDAGGEDFKF